MYEHWSTNQFRVYLSNWPAETCTTIFIEPSFPWRTYHSRRELIEKGGFSNRSTFCRRNCCEYSPFNQLMYTRKRLRKREGRRGLCYWNSVDRFRSFVHLRFCRLDGDKRLYFVPFAPFCFHNLQPCFPPSIASLRRIFFLPPFHFPTVIKAFLFKSDFSSASAFVHFYGASEGRKCFMSFIQLLLHLIPGWESYTSSSKEFSELTTQVENRHSMSKIPCMCFRSN